MLQIRVNYTCSFFFLHTRIFRSFRCSCIKDKLHVDVAESNKYCKYFFYHKCMSDLSYAKRERIITVFHRHLQVGAESLLVQLHSVFCLCFIFYRRNYVLHLHLAIDLRVTQCHVNTVKFSPFKESPTTAPQKSRTQIYSTQIVATNRCARFSCAFTQQTSIEELSKRTIM